MGRHWGEQWGNEYPHRDVIEAIILAAIKVQRIIGPGVVENVYKICQAHGLRLDGHKVFREVHLDLTYEGLCVPNAYKMDLSSTTRSWSRPRPLRSSPTPVSPN
jgi:hypothetical protein